MGSLTESAPSRRPGVLPTLATLAVVALCVTAGLWQRDRMEQKLALRAQVESAARSEPVAFPRTSDWEPWRFRRVQVTGTFDAPHQILIDNRVREGRVGYDVVAPLVLADGRAVAVERGWVPGGATRAQLPDVPPPPGEVTIAGRVNHPPSPYLELARDTSQGRVWQNLDLARYEKISGRPLLPVVVEQTDAAGPGDELARDWPAPDVGVEKHRNYMVQWFAFAATAIGFWIYFAWRRLK